MGGDIVLDLTVVNEAYGEFADLYTDVLRVSKSADHEEIQLAYFDRRSALFSLLAKIDAKPQTEQAAEERSIVERQMDAVVFAVRVLGDAEERAAYDRNLKVRRMNRRRAHNGELPVNDEPITQVRSGFDAFNSRKVSTKEMRKKNIREENTNLLDLEEVADDASKATNDTDNLTLEDSDSNEDLTLATEETRVDTGVLSCLSGSRILSKIADEITGACEDTIVSVDQVFNAFTLTDKDIKAVTRKIDRAKRQLDN